MLLDYSTSKIQKYLLLSLVSIGIIIMSCTFLGKEVVKTATDLIYIPVTGILVILSTILVLRFGKNGSYAKAWLFFLGVSVSWFIAETAWTVLELDYHIDPFPSIADLFYVVGYPFMFCFLFYYLKPVRRAITTRMLMTAISVSAMIAIPSVYMAYDFDPKVSAVENALATLYPIADSIIFVPSLIGIALFFRGQVNFTWSLICIGIALLAIGDTGFQVTTFTNSYYTGHPVDIILLWSYVFFSFGLFDHIQIFKEKNSGPIIK